MDTFPDLGALSDQELKNLIDELTQQEQEVSYERRILHGKIDILRAELVNRLRRKRDGLFIDDLGSLNGTYVNRRRIESHKLVDGDELQIGKYKLTYLG